MYTFAYKQLMSAEALLYWVRHSVRVIIIYIKNINNSIPLLNYLSCVKADSKARIKTKNEPRMVLWQCAFRYHSVPVTRV